MFICVSDDLRIEQCYDIAQLIIAEPFWFYQKFMPLCYMTNWLEIHFLEFTVHLIC